MKENVSSSDGGHPQREGSQAGDWHPHHQQEHVPHTQDHRPSQSREACALHPQAHRLQPARRHGSRSQGSVASPMNNLRSK